MPSERGDKGSSRERKAKDKPYERGNRPETSTNTQLMCRVESYTWFYIQKAFPSSREIARRNEDHEDAISFPDGDVVLRSRDGVEFTVHAFLLRMASPVLRDMLGPPQENLKIKHDPDVKIKHDPDMKIVTSRRVYALEEDSKTLNVITRYIYPAERPKTDTLEDAMFACNAVKKFEITCAKVVENALAHHLDMLSSTNPLRAWAIAKNFNLNTAASLAAVKFVESNDDSLDSTTIQWLQPLSGSEYAELVYRKNRVVSAGKQVVVEWKRPCPQCRGSSDSEWDRKYLQNVQNLSPFDRSIRSGVVFYIASAACSCPSCRTIPAGAFIAQLGTALQRLLDQVHLASET